MAVVERYNADGLILTTGAAIRPRDAAEDKYHLARTTPRAAWDGATPILPFVGESFDDRLPYDDGQGQIGACVGFSMRAGAWLAARYAARQAGNGLRLSSIVPAHAGAIYEQGRKMRGWFPQDTGMYAADGCDILLDGCPDGNAAPYYADARFEYPATVWDGKASRDYVLSHRPFYPTEAEPWSALASALAAGFPVAVGSYWPARWFNPRSGIVDPLAPFGPDSGAHEYIAWGITRDHLLCLNHWTAGWTPDAGASGLPYMRPGDFAIPRSVIERQGSPIFEFRALAYEPVVAPEPEPEPEPSGRRLFSETWHRESGAWVLREQHDLPLPDNGGAAVAIKLEERGEQTMISPWYYIDPPVATGDIRSGRRAKSGKPAGR